MAQLTVYQRSIDQIFDRIAKYAVLDTVTWTVDTDGNITGSSSSKSAIKAEIQDLTAEDNQRISAGFLPTSDRVVYVSRVYTLRSGKYLSGTDTKQQFIHFPGDGSSTPPASAKIYEILKVELVPHPADFTSLDTSDANLAYTKAYVKEVQDSG